MASALETLCGQSYGAKQYHMLGIYLQRSWIILFIWNLFILPVFIFTSPLLKLIGQEESIAEMAGTISKWFIPVMFFYILSYTLQMYLQSQIKNIIITYLAVLTLALHLGLSWLMVLKLNLGLVGVMTSMIIAIWIPLLYGFQCLDSSGLCALGDVPNHGKDSQSMLSKISSRPSNFHYHLV